LAIAIISLAFAANGFAQAVSGVTGIIVDSVGSVVPGATVVLTDTKTSRELTTKTNGDGAYTFQNVAPGDGYKISITQTGFQTLTISDVTLGVGKTETYNATLPAGNVSATVDVTATGNGDTLNTTDASLGNVIDTRQLRELPIQIRNSPAALIGLQPGVIGNNVGTGSTNRVGSVTGSRADQGNITVDGIDANDQATGQAFSTVGNAPIDAIQEFRAVTTNPSASEGRSAGGQIQLVTKGGSNTFHGSLREYNRIERFAANSYFANAAGRYTAADAASNSTIAAGDLKQPRPHLVRNQFGGSLGGRIIKDKLFFFFDYEGRRDAQGVPSTRIVPLDHFRAGGLGYINNNAGCGATSRLNTTPGCITVLTPTQVTAIDPKHVGPNAALLAFINARYPRANDFSLGDGVNTGGFRFNAASNRKDNTYTTRFDWNPTDTQKVFVRLNIAKRIQTDTVNSVAEQFPGDPETAQIQVNDYSIAGGHSWAITSRLFNQFTIGNSHSGLKFPTLFKPQSPNQYTFMNTTTGGQISAPYAGISDQDRIVDTPTIRDDATYLFGNHNLVFGAQIKPIRSKSGLVNDFNSETVGLGGNRTAFTTVVNPGVGANPGQGLANSTTAKAAYDRAFAFLLGRIGSIATNFNYDKDGTPLPLATGKKREYLYNEYEFYVQDNWKFRSSLTVNFGLRYQYYQPPYEKNGFQGCNDTDYDTLVAKRLANGPAGTAGDAAEPFLTYDLCGKGNNGRSLYKPDRNNFAPRLGFAYAPSFKDGLLGTLFGDRKTSIRGGASVTYDRVSGALTFIQDQVSYLFDNSATTNFGGSTTAADLINDPRFTAIGTLPASNTPPTITRPNTPFVDAGFPFGNAEGQTNYTIAQNFQTPYNYQWSFGFQRELPKNMLLDVSYVGRLGKKLFTQSDAAQIIDFKDPASGQTLLQALNVLQGQLAAGAPTTSQPFFENQGALALGAPCTDPNFGFGAPCTDVLVGNVGSLILVGDASDTTQFANAVGLLRNNIGLSGQFSTNAYITNQGHSRYNGLLISLQKRFSQGNQFDVNYTYSRSRDNNSSVANTVFGGLVCDIRDLNVCEGPSDFDVHHLLNINGILELPFGKGKRFGGHANGWVNQFIGGFQLSGILTARSGLPFSTTTGSFPVGFVFDSPAVLTGTLPTGQIHDTTSGVQYFNDSATALGVFRNPRHGEIGQRNNLRGPSFWTVDMGLAKNFALPWEGQRLQLRVDAFNAFNHNVFGLPNANFNSTTTPFGIITTSASAPRELQFAIRWDF
ncbi:MAG TPA: TonB-dependent receptor, partial [Pyrinomonadaceae bacterium]|nr:TonB-dependent receptor [Pyrinomonadaceae bacterium]